MTTEIPLTELDAALWEGLETAHWSSPATMVPRVLHRMALAGPEASPEDCELLHCLVPEPGRPLPSAAPVAVPLLLALARDPGMGAVRAPLTVLLARVLRADSELAARHRPDTLPLLADRDPAVRRAALPLAPDPECLLGLWRIEADPSVRLSLVRALGMTGTTGARAVLAETLTEDHPALYVAAVHASAVLDPDLPVRHLPRLLSLLTDPSLRARFDDVWYVPHRPDALTREHLLWTTYGLLAPHPELQAAFPGHLLAAAERTGDETLRREAVLLARHHTA
ncbi:MULTISPECIES: hypothetical protein [Kitasatospora]|uniref:Uncharacterized protein n=1 Tax=Kitasatospora setae (strain ATCC 33774 / DSM 43861 / JCM 3304 / KCC A-0304 / NBRC 14216 / KM-6054) TaxID=452652 RepID=E4N924_KITSK|nr:MULTISPECIES: hypothetical protein [Kitasatospora]BAJ27705.1 hypothetical protein KSE_18810 [Kitasatospora setae KM-6054]